MKALHAVSMLMLAMALVALSGRADVDPPVNDIAKRDRQVAMSGSPHVFTTEELEASRPVSPNGIPDLAGMVKCAADVKCFTDALDQQHPAALTRTETSAEGPTVMTANSTWWTTRYSGDQCEVSIRVDDFKISLNDKAVESQPQEAREEIASKVDDANHDFEQIRGKVSTCTMATKDLQAVMASPNLSLMSLGPVTHQGQDCTGAAFEPPSLSLPAAPAAPEAGSPIP